MTDRESFTLDKPTCEEYRTLFFVTIRRLAKRVGVCWNAAEWEGMMLLTRDRSFYRDLLVLAIPVALQNFITFAVTLADNLMTGALGDASISGVYMGGQI